VTEAQQRPPFHFAFPVTDLAAARGFYCDLLGCAVGRESERWIDFDFHGHQISAHLVDETQADGPTNTVDGKRIPVRHFGLVLDWQAWHELEKHLRESGIDFLVEPHIRFRGETGEQATLFLRDPSGNCIEFKSFRDPGRLFAR